MSTTDGRSDRRGILRTRPTPGQLAWTGILALMGLAQVIRMQPFDALFFAAAVAVTVLDATGFLSGATQARRISVRLLVGIGAVSATAISLLPRHGPAMIMLVLMVGVGTFLLVWPGAGTKRNWTPGLRRLAWCWAIIIVVGCLWELVAFLIGHTHPSSPALSDLIDPLLAQRLGQAVFSVLWVSLGVWLARRVVRR